MSIILIEAKAATPAGAIDWKDSVTADSLSTAIMISESNLRISTGSMHARFTAVRAMDEPILMEGNSE